MLLLCEHLRRRSLIRLKLSQQEVNAGLLQLELVTELDQEFVGWLIGQTEVDEGLDEPGHLIENQILVSLHLLLLLVLVGGDETLD